MFSIILPAYNEADKIESSIQKLTSILKSKNISFEIIIAEDGSTDGTDRIAARLAKENKFIKHLHYDERLGRGLALKRCGEILKGNYLAYMDVDLAPRFGEKLVDVLNEFKNGFDIVIGSRYHELSKTKRSFERKVASKSYNFLQKILFGVPIKDLQCGFKSFRRDVFIQMNKEVDANGWFWDTEMLIRSFLKGYKIKEIPVEWKEGKQTKVKMIKDSLSMGTSLIKLWFKLKISNSNKVKFPHLKVGASGVIRYPSL
jgi:glycosyltransferase involved in cell wall biosynthesis